VHLLLGRVSVPNFYNFPDFTLRRLYGGGVSAKANASWSRGASRSTLPLSSTSLTIDQPSFIECPGGRWR